MMSLEAIIQPGWIWRWLDWWQFELLVNAVYLFVMIVYTVRFNCKTRRRLDKMEKCAVCVEDLRMDGITFCERCYERYVE